MEQELRQSGIHSIGKVPWGTHFCQFYQTKEDLSEVLALYFKAGLENNEFCMWVTSLPLKEEDAKAALKKVLPDFDAYLKKGQLEIIPHSEWYLKNGVFDSKRVLAGWIEKLNQALSKGYNGLRLTGNTFWLEKENWNDFVDYEEEVNKVIGRYKIIALCAYSLEKCGINEILDVAGNHQFAIVKRSGKWEFIKNSNQANAEEALRQSEERFSMVLNHAVDAAYRWNFQTDRYDYSGPVIERISGFTPEEYQSMSLDDALRRIHPEDLERVQKRFKDSLISNCSSGAIEYRFKHKNGSYRWIDNRYAIVKDSNNRPLYRVGVIRDVTEQKEIEQALKNSEEKYRGLFASIKDGIVMADLTGNILECNQAYLDMLGYERDEIKKMSLYNLTPSKWLKMENHIMKNQVLKRGYSNIYEKECIRKNGTIFPVNIKTWLRREEGKNPELWSIVRDITKESEIEKAKTEFVSLASHQLRTPLTDISLSTELLIRGQAGALKKEQKKYLQNIYEGVEEMTELIEMLLNISRIEMGTILVDPRPVNLKIFTDKVLGKFSMQIKKKKLVLKKRFAKAIPLINLDQKLLELVLDNLLSNAVKYTEKGTIVIEIKKQKEDVLIKVADTGCGIPLAQQGHIFTKQFRSDNPLKTKVKGTGLGLYIVKAAVKQIGGKVWYESRENEGTTFFVTIPLKGMKKTTQKRLF